MLIIISCRTTLRSLGSDKIPAEVGQHFSVIVFDSLTSLQPAQFRYETDTHVSIFTMEASLVNGQVKGKLQEKKFPKYSSNLPEGSSKEKTFGILLKYKICCSNHKPNDCVNSKSEAADSASKKGCNSWRLIVL